MKNEWDMLALVQRRLAACQSCVVFPYVTQWLTEPDGRSGRVRDDTGQQYEIGPDFLAGVVPALHVQRISFSIDNGDRVLRFGPKLPPPPKSYWVNGQELPVLDLTSYGPFRLAGLDFTPSPPRRPADDETEPDAG